MIVQRRAYQLQKRSAFYGGDYKLVIVPVHSKQSHKSARIMITYSGNNRFSGKG